jgi:D-arabinose 1-dehydrogenase-like Zn-dependent alcohol dehydrogenase
MPETGFVAVFRGVRRPFDLMEFPVPEPAPGAVLVKVRMANVCGSDLHAWRGEYDIARGQTEPYCLSIGHEMCGEVARLGEGVTHDSAGRPLAVGDRIVYQYFNPCGRCAACRRGKTPRCETGMRYRLPPTEYPHFNAAYGQYYYLRPGQAVFKVPDNVPDDLAGPANCALAQVIEGLERGRLGPGDTLVIQGAGGLGINAVAVARERGVSRIIVIDAFESRLELAREFGADDLISIAEHPAPEDRVRRVRELTDGQGADAVLELVGSAAVVPEGLEMLASGGDYLMIGNINQRQRCEIRPADLVHGGKTIHGLMWYRPASLHKALTLLSTRADRYPFHRILSHRYPLRAITQAFQDQNAGRVQRAALLPWA